MPEQQDMTARLRATIEEELGSYRHFAGLTSADLEMVSGRLVRAIAPLLGFEERERTSRAA
jgi:hypothetical protein